MWREQFGPPTSGTNGNPVTYNAYGEGADPIINANADLQDAAYKWTASGNGTNEWYIELAGGGDPGWAAEINAVFLDGVYLQDAAAGSLSDHEFDYADNDELGWSTVYIRDDTGDPDGSGVTIEGSVLDYACYAWARSYNTFDGIHFEGGDSGCVHFGGGTSDYLIFQNCTITKSASNGIRLRENCEYNTIDSCTVNYNGGSGVVFVAASTNGVISNNTIHNNGLNEDTKEDSGISGDCTTWTINGNTIYANGNATGGNEGYAHGIYPGVSTTGCNIYDNTIHSHAYGKGIFMKGPGTIYRNKCYDNRTAGVGTGGNGATDVVITIRYNLLWNNHEGISENNKGAGDLTLNIYNNVFYENNDQTAGVNPSEIDINDDLTALVVQNNIFSGDGAEYEFESPAQSAATINNNCWLNGDFYYDGAARNWAYWTATAGFDANGLNTDPLMTNPGSDVFTLQAGSPCIDAGAHVGLFLDYAEHPVPMGHQPDIGAYEHKGGSNALFF